MNLVSVVLIILGSGILGGLANFFLLTEMEKEGRTAWQYIATGVCAAFIVPLFLSTISSNLLVDLIDDTSKASYSKFFVFLGFTLIAALSSRSFIKTVSEKILERAREATDSAKQAADRANQATEDAKQAADGAAAVVDTATRATDSAKQAADSANQATEQAKQAADGAAAAVNSANQVIDSAKQAAGSANAAALGAEEIVSSLREDDDETIPSSLEAAHVGNDNLSQDEIDVLHAMRDSVFLARSLRGLEKQTEMASPQLLTTIASLLNRGLLREIKSTKGVDLWRLTSIGRERASA